MDTCSNTQNHCVLPATNTHFSSHTRNFGCWLEISIQRKVSKWILTTNKRQRRRQETCTVFAFCSWVSVRPIHIVRARVRWWCVRVRARGWADVENQCRGAKTTKLIKCQDECYRISKMICRTCFIVSGCTPKWRIHIIIDFRVCDAFRLFWPSKRKKK